MLSKKNIIQGLKYILKPYNGFNNILNVTTKEKIDKKKFFINNRMFYKCNVHFFSNNTTESLNIASSTAKETTSFNSTNYATYTVNSSKNIEDICNELEDLLASKHFVLFKPNFNEFKNKSCIFEIYHMEKVKKKIKKIINKLFQDKIIQKDDKVFFFYLYCNNFFKIILGIGNVSLKTKNPPYKVEIVKENENKIKLSTTLQYNTLGNEWWELVKLLHKVATTNSLQ